MRMRFPSTSSESSNRWVAERGRKRRNNLFNNWQEIPAILTISYRKRRRRPNICLILVHRRKRWPNIRQILVRRLVVAGQEMREYKLMFFFSQVAPIHSHISVDDGLGCPYDDTPSDQRISNIVSCVAHSILMGNN